MHPFAARLPESGTDYWTGLTGSSRALAINRAAAQHAGLTLVITRSGHQANILEQDLELLSDGELPILHFPDWETLPYDLYSPHPDIISRRLATLAALPRLQQGIVLLPVSTLMQRIAPTNFVLGRTLSVEIGQSLELELFRNNLLQAGYEGSDQVIRPGQFAVRGNLLDLFAMGSTAPYRIELFDDEVETIRSFDPDSQRSLDKTDRIQMLPAREYPYDENAIQAFRRDFRLRFEIDTRHCPLYQDLRQNLHPQGLEYYLPLFFEQTSSLLEYLPAPPSLIIQGDTLAGGEAFWQQIEDRYEQRRHDIQRPVLPPADLYFSVAEISHQLSSLPTVSLADPEHGVPAARSIDFACQPAPAVDIHQKSSQPAAALTQLVEQPDLQVLIAADSPGRRELLLDTLHAFGLQPTSQADWPAFAESGQKFGIAVLPLEDGFICAAQPALCVLTESQLFAGRIRQRQPGRGAERDPESIIRDLTDLHSGAPVVHEDHGVGRYQGLKVLSIDGLEHEFLTLEYADGDKLYVPVAALNLISRYTGSPAETAPLHRLGGNAWDRVRQKAAIKARDAAAELLNLYARRQSRPGYAYDLDNRMYNDFAATFPFEETSDQQSAINAVLADMRSDQPMDRVVCGDVGFGKTEVALRAAFVAVQAGRQVALLVPTTLLAQQHFATFSDRFADWPVKVEALSRFRSGKQTSEIVAALRDGTLDIVIGTHRLIQQDVQFKDLGLVILDEEQRFGVRQKERLKALRAEVDVLTLTATPIPRTLNLALSGLRDLSIIATPPARRMAIKTFVCQWDNTAIREALQREIQRGGQVYFLHNEVQTIEKTTNELEQLMPDARIRFAHGQMHKRELESVMQDFYRQRIQVLVCTTIIESGLDVPSANTIIINRADKFGLSQLHQLRGRVGRSHHRAYAYLLIPGLHSITRDARKRLEAIESMEELGAGFTLATHDLEIRGAGELLGEEQSGQIHEVGFSLYMDLLGRAVTALKNGREPDLEQPLATASEIQLQVAALIPENYLPDVHTRLIMYKRIASASDAAALRELQVEMIDRFGLLPEALKNLFRINRIKQQAMPLGIRKIVLGAEGGRLEFSEQAAIEPARLIRLIESEADSYQMQGPQKLRVSRELKEPRQRFAFLERLLDSLAA